MEKRFGRLIEDQCEEVPEGKEFRKGLKTPQTAYHVPILQALVDLGGRS